MDSHRQDIGPAASQTNGPALDQKFSKSDIEAAHNAPNSADNSMVDAGSEAALIDFKTLSWW